MPLGPQERALFEAEGAELYEEIVSAGGLAPDDARIAPGGDRHRAFALLCDLGLLTQAEDGASWTGVDPATVQSQVVGPLGQQGAELISESAHWAKAFGSLSQTWRRSPSAAGGPVAELRGIATINAFLSALVSEAEDELLTAQPQFERALKNLTDVGAHEIALLERGLRIRTLYQHAARRSTDTRRYVAAVTAAGAEVRTLDEFFNRLIVVDRRTAVIPSHKGHAAAMVIREPSVVAYLVDMFERHWERSRPFTSSETSLLRDIAAEQRAMTIRMLLEGRADPAGAKRLGVSPRTYAAYVADLKNEFEVETRFQLGYAMGQQGISGRED
jgi:sugar-specific transcriptional regulator TrmB